MYHRACLAEQCLLLYEMEEEAYTMQTRHSITKVSYAEVKKAMGKSMAGTYVKFSGPSGRTVDLWLEQTCSYQLLPAGISIRKQFSGERAGQGFEILVTPQNTGNVMLFDGLVAAQV